MTRRAFSDLLATLRERNLLVDVSDHSLPAYVTGVGHESAKIKPGELFVALTGTRTDGRVFVSDAHRRGAAAVLTEPPGLPAGIPHVTVTSARVASAVAAAWFAGFPSRHLGVIGITGTDGKTTTCWLVRAILEAAGIQTGLVTTTDYIVGGRSLGNSQRMTTPDAHALQELLRSMVEAGDHYAVLEVSSHGLAQERVGEVAFDAAVLTNIGHEHLDYHKTFTAYRAAKRVLFERLAISPSNPVKETAKVAAINRGERYRAEFEAAAVQAGAIVLTYGRHREADIRANAATFGERGARFRAITPTWSETIELPLLGRFNLYNALAAIAVTHGLGLSREAIVEGIAEVSPVPGRMERLRCGQPFDVVVDYAHTPEALKTVLSELRRSLKAGGRIIAVFGSAGGRHINKRLLMGRVAAQFADALVVTEEDPRSEDSSVIAQQIVAGAVRAGARPGDNILRIDDRAEALRTALSLARPSDVVLLAGKGHERSIERASEVVEWNEAAVAEAILRDLGHAC